MKRLSLFLFSFLLTLVLFSSIRDVRAGCPSSTPDNPSIPWVGEFSYTAVLGGGCSTKVFFCTRVIPGSPDRFDYVVTKVQPLDYSAPCGTYDWEWYIKAAQLQILIDNPAEHPCPTCDPPNNPWVAQYYSVSATCWKYVNMNPNPAGPPMMAVAICEETGWCMQGQLVCCDPHTGFRHVISQGKYVAVSSPCETTLPWPPISQTPVFYPAGCYYIDPCDD